VPRVLLVFEPPDGGVPENVAQLALGLKAHGWSAEVAGPARASVYPELEAAGVGIHRLALTRGHGRVGEDGRALTGLRRLLSERRYDLIHSHASKAGVIGRIASQLAGTPSLYSPHCFAFATGLPRPWRMAAAGVERALGRAGGDVLCVCQHERQQAIRFGVARPEQLHVVYNGCEPAPEGLEDDPALLRLRERGPVVGAIAALREQKRLDLLVDAVPLILARVPHASVAIVGNGPLQDRLQAQVTRAGLAEEERFALLPFTAPAARALQSLDVYVLPSDWEAFSIGILEALACGVPQVVTDVGGNGEAVTGATGKLVAPGDAHALAQAIVGYLLDPDRRAAASVASRERHLALFGLARMVAETAAVYDTVLAANGKRQSP
jgi:glycosyltransferase involved in cell wall biosynthesis